MIENINVEKNRNHLNYLFFIFPILQIVVFYYFSDLIFEEVQVGTFSIIYLFILFLSSIFLVLGSVLRYKNSNKSKYFFGISFLCGIAALFFWKSPMAIACVIPTFAAFFANYSKSINRKYSSLGVIIFGLVGLTLSIALIYSDQHKAIEKVKEILIDSESAIFRNIRTPQGYKSLVCGEVNAKNKMGGYDGFQKFIVVNNKAAIIGDEKDISGIVDSNLTKSCDKLYHVLRNEKFPNYLN